MYDIEKSENGSKGRFYIQESNGKLIAEMTYSKAGKEKIIIDHTEVNPDYRGQKLGEKLLLVAVSHARDNDLSIIPLCPFAKATFQKNNELQDVL